MAADGTKGHREDRGLWRLQTAIEGADRREEDRKHRGNIGPWRALD
jgi:hypothetical protein